MAWHDRRGPAFPRRVAGLSESLVAITVLSTALVLPRVGEATYLGQIGEAGTVLSTQAAATMLTLAGVLPVSLGIARVRQQFAPATDGAPLMPYGIGFWRIETVLLLVLAMLIAPIAAGRWRPRRLEGAVLALAYVFYVLVVTAAGDKWH